jgi:hypothetical protein
MSAVLKGHIYISGIFTSVDRSEFSRPVQLDNDPHFWDGPPTWGICRPDIREKARVGEYVFFVLPKKAELPQMIYGYTKIAEIITHAEAYHRPELNLKRMGNKNPNGNIIVDERGLYNRFDVGVHKGNFEKIKRRYVIGSNIESEFLTQEKIWRLAPEFLPFLNRLFGVNQGRVIDVVSRWGSLMSSRQVLQLLDWLREGERI